MAALLTSEAQNTDKVVKYVDEVKHLGIDLLPPSIVESRIEFSPSHDETSDSILFGLGAIKGVGSKAIESILEAREEKPFEDLSDFIARVDGSKVNKRVLEALIKSGAMDSFGYSRRALIDQIEKIVESGQEAARAQKMAVGSLFGEDEELTKVTIKIDDLPEYDGKNILELEKETLGFYVSGHPLDEFREEISKIKHSLSSEIDEIADGSKTLFIGKIESITQKISKKGNKFGIVKLMDFHGDIEFMVFEKTLVQIAMMDQNRPIAFKVQITRDDRGVNKRVLKVSDLEGAKKEKTDIKKEVVKEPVSPIFVKIEIDDDDRVLQELYRLVKEHPGNRPLKLILSSKLQDVVIESNIEVNGMIVEKLEAITSIKVAA